MKIKNYDEILDEFTDLLAASDKVCSRYISDIYLYFDAESGEARLETFVNVGGNSWLDDDHYTLYRDKGRMEDWLDWYQGIDTIASFLGMTEGALRTEAAAYAGLDADEEADRAEVEEYIRSGAHGYDKVLYAAFCEEVDSHMDEYRESAVRILDEFLEEN